MDVAAAPSRLGWTAKKYYAWSRPDDGTLYEVLNGELIMTASPVPRHQQLVFRIAKLIDAWATAQAAGEVFVSPIDVVLGDDVVIPDVVFVSAGQRSIIGPERIEGAPELVVEVLSLSTSQRDLRLKWDLYARSGVREYWVVNPEAATVEVLTLVNGAYQRHVLAQGETPITSQVLSGFSAPVSSVFAP
ncbi:MAG: Uma2 family endonuclease [Anaerolineales bacterium]|nr:Uma2 family endonuclease [Anaerolineales bacterium]